MDELGGEEAETYDCGRIPAAFHVGLIGQIIRFVAMIPLIYLLDG